LLNLTNLFALLDARGEKVKLSKETGISTGNISDWKRGRAKPSAEALCLMADHFNTSVDFLLGRTDIRDAETKKAPVPEISENGREMLALYEQLPYKEQVLLIGRLQEMVSPLAGDKKEEAEDATQAS